MYRLWNRPERVARITESTPIHPGISLCILAESCIPDLRYTGLLFDDLNYASHCAYLLSRKQHHCQGRTPSNFYREGAQLSHLTSLPTLFNVPIKADPVPSPDTNSI